MSHAPTTLSKGELDRQLDSALKATFPASDPVSIGEPSGAEPDRPLDRRPATLDVELVKELAHNVEAAHGPKHAMQKPKPDDEATAPDDEAPAIDLEEDLATVQIEQVDTDSNDVPTADANGDSDDERDDENQAVPDPT